LVKSDVKLGRNAHKTYAILFEAYDKEAMKMSSVFVWHKPFKEGRENVEDDEKSRRAKSHKTDANVGKVQNLLLSDRLLNINQAYYGK